MDLILCHQTADFDAIGAAVGLSKLRPGSRIILTGGAHPKVREFLALHRDELALLEMRSVNPKLIRSLIVVDNQQRDRLGKAAAWLDLAQIEQIELYDHHLGVNGDIKATCVQVESVGATTTLIAEKLQQAGVDISAVEATVMALGIHVDTGSLTFEQTTARDARALAWLMEKGALVKIVAEYADPGFSPQLQRLFTEAMAGLQSQTVQGYLVAWILIETDAFVAGLSNLAERLLALTESDALIFVHVYRQRGDKTRDRPRRLAVIARSRIEGTNLTALLEPLGGGGHAQAASAHLREGNPEIILENLIQDLIAQIPVPLTARDLMSSPVRTVRPQVTIEQAQRVLFRYGHSGLSVVNEQDQLVGIISRRDLDLALHHGFSHAPVKGYMTRNVRTIAPDTPLPAIEELMVTYDVGRLPVVEGGKLLGIVTRTDLLRQLHQSRSDTFAPGSPDHENGGDCAQASALTASLLPLLRDRLTSAIWNFLEQTAAAAHDRGWHLYLVGGAVRDLLLAPNNQPLLLQDIDLVVDGFHQAAEVGAGVALAKTVQVRYPQAKLSIHGEFQTAALIWHRHGELGSLLVDIATARTEFYPYPAANPEVEASSIRQDLYRRDFTVNALAVRLTPPRSGELLDFFGGWLDLRSQQIRVLHANSFIEDPTRIFRAVRFALRLGFQLESQTQTYIRYAIDSGIYERLRLEDHPAPALRTRLKTELKYLLEADYWPVALALLADLDALKCLHSQLVYTDALAWQLRYLSRWLHWLVPVVTVDPWLLRLEGLLATLPTGDRQLIAQNLHLPQSSSDRLASLSEVERDLQHHLPRSQRPSDRVKLLRAYSPGLLILVAARSNKILRRQIWHYLTVLTQIAPPINGDDLKALGYKPGPFFKEALEAVLMATLDGEISDREGAIRKVQSLAVT
jgi:tRNA nucleotidyltransferase (CCA-adding enzyme)